MFLLYSFSLRNILYSIIFFISDYFSKKVLKGNRFKYESYFKKDNRIDN